MAFDESPRFPEGISYGSRVGLGFNSSIVRMSSGAETIAARWSEPLRRYDVSYGIKSLSDLRTLLRFYTLRQGAARGFRFKDPLEFTSSTDGVSSPSATNSVIGTGDNSETQFQLSLTYTDAGNSTTRPIRKPVDSTTLIAFDGTPQASGWSVDTSTGIVTFTSAPGTGITIAAGFEFDVPVRFDEEADEALQAAIQDFDIGGIQRIGLVELRSSVSLSERWPFTGFKDHGDIGGGTVSALYADGTLQRVAPTTTGGKLLLPAEADMAPDGGPHFVFANEGTQTATIVRNDGTTLDTVLANQSRSIWAYTDASSNRVWVSFKGA